MTDPRFDPAFQRGYAGPDPELVAREKVPAAPGEAPVEAPVVASVESAPVVPDAAPAPEAVDPPEPLARAPRNPYRLALLLFGFVLLIAAASTLYWQVLHPQATSTTVDSQFVEALVSSVPPSLALAGLICVILWLALGALDHANPDPVVPED